MKRTTNIHFLIIIFTINILTISCNNSKTANKSTSDIKNNRSRSELVKKGINSFYKNDTLHVFDKKNRKRTSIKLFEADTLYQIVQTENEKYLFVGLSAIGDCAYQFIGLLDLQLNDWVVCERLDPKSKQWSLGILSNPTFVGSTNENKYFLFEGGTGVIREFHVYNLQGKLIKKSRYMSNSDKNELQWDKYNRFYYFDIANNRPTSLPKPKVNNEYIQKIYWVDGKDSITNVFNEVYVE